ncbi:hypothetical protein [Flavobacterium sp. PL11]|uniref:hypothetical protein n=1 Tax=Flavobacterium sp. PL11 TaxID=3071717 RepID=UPI002E10A631
MKKIVLLSVFTATTMLMNSCTTDDLENNLNKEKFIVNASSDSSGDQNGQTTIPPHKKN